MCLCPRRKFEVWALGLEPAVSLYALHRQHDLGLSWEANSKFELRWWQLLTRSHSDTSWVSWLQAQARSYAWGWQLWGAIPGGAEPLVGELPWAAWAGGCSEQKPGLESRLTSSWKDWVYWAVPWSLWPKPNRPVKQSKRRRLHKYGLEPSGKKCFLQGLGPEMLL